MELLYRKECVEFIIAPDSSYWLRVSLAPSLDHGVLHVQVVRKNERLAISRKGEWCWRFGRFI